MKNVGCIIENVTPFSYLTAYENMKLCGRFYDDADDAELIKVWITGLLKYRMKIKNYPRNKQRLGIAIATLSNQYYDSGRAL